MLPPPPPCFQVPVEEVPVEHLMTGRPSWVPDSMPGFTFEFDPIYYLKIRKSFQVIAGAAKQTGEAHVQAPLPPEGFHLLSRQAAFVADNPP